MRLSWLSSLSQRSSCLCLSSSEIIGAGRHTQQLGCKIVLLIDINQTSRFLVLPLMAPVYLLNFTHVLENSQEGAPEPSATSQLP